MNQPVINDVTLSKFIDELRQDVSKSRSPLALGRISVIKSIVELEAVKKQKGGSTIDSVFARIKSLVINEKDVVKLQLLVGLLSDLSGEISVEFCLKFWKELLLLYKQLLNKFSQNNGIVVNCIRLFSSLIVVSNQDPKKKEDWTSEEVEIFQIGVFQFVNDQNVVIQSTSMGIIGRLVSLKNKRMSTNIGKLLLKALEETKDDGKKSENINSLLKLISKNFLKLSSNFIVQLVKIFMKKTISVKKNQKLCFQTLNKLFSNEQNLLPPMYYVNIFKALLMNYEIIEGSYLFMLKNGVLKLMSLNYVEFYTILPSVFKLLVKNFNYKSDEISLIATKCLKDLIRKTITESFIADAYKKKKSSCLWKLILEVKRGLTFFNIRFVSDILSIMKQFFLCLGEKSFPILNFLLLDLNKIYLKSSEIVQKSIEKLIGTAISIIGPQKYFSVIPFNSYFKKGDKLKDSWILQVLSNYIQNTDLQYFFKFLMPIAKKVLLASGKLVEKDPSESFRYRTLSVQIWNLFPRFCILPRDFNTFGTVVNDLLSLVRTNETLFPVILKGISRLISSNKKVVKSNDVPKFCIYSVDLARKALTLLSSFSKLILDTLFPLFVSTSPNRKQIIGNTIGSVISVSSEHVINEYFKNLITILLQKDSKKEVKKKQVKNGMGDDNEERNDEYKTMNLAISLIPSLTPKMIMLFFNLIKGQIDDKDPRIQKKTYKALFEISKFFPNFILTKQIDIFKIVVQNINSYSSASAKFRFRIIVNLIKIIDRKIVSQGMNQIIGESVLGTMSYNSSVRNYSREIMSVVVKKIVFDDGSVDLSDLKELNEEQKGNLLGIFKILYAGLGGETTLMISGTVNGFTCLCKEYFSMIPTTVVVSIMKKVLKLLEYQAGDVFSACLYFLKMVVKKLDKNVLKPFCPQLVVQMISQLQKHSSGNRRVLVQLILEKLLRIYDYDYLKNLFSSIKDHIKILQSVRKKMKSKEKKKKKKKKADDLRTNDSRIRIKLNREDDDPVNFLESKALRAINVTKRFNEHEYMSSIEDDRYEISYENNKLTIKEKKNEEGEIRKTVGKKRRFEEITGDIDNFSRFDKEDEEEENLLEVKEPSQKRIKISEELARELKYIGKSDNYIRNKEKARKKEEKFKKVNFGQKFRSRKGRGDIKKKGSVDPVAYIPLSRDVLSYRNKNKKTAFDKYKEITRRRKRY